MATLISLVIGALAAVLLWRYRFPGKTVVEGAFTLPLVVPEICMGVAMLLFFTRVLPWPNNLIWPFNLGSIIIAHVSFCFPFVALVVGARLASFNKEQEEAARDLGANDWQAFRDILLPHIKPALIAGASARLHPVARRFRDHVLHLRARHRHLPGQGLFDAALLGDA